MNKVQRGTSAYTRVHEWINREHPRTGVCEECGQQDKPTEYANISGEYRRDRADFRELCHRCHMISDGRIGPKSPSVRAAISEGRLRGIGSGEPMSEAHRRAISDGLRRRKERES